MSNATFEIYVPNKCFPAPNQVGLIVGARALTGSDSSCHSVLLPCILSDQLTVYWFTRVLQPEPRLQGRLRTYSSLSSLVVDAQQGGTANQQVLHALET